MRIPTRKIRLKVKIKGVTVLSVFCGKINLGIFGHARGKFGHPNMR